MENQERAHNVSESDLERSDERRVTWGAWRGLRSALAKGAREGSDCEPSYVVRNGKYGKRVCHTYVLQ